MKKTFMAIMILIILSYHVTGQEAQDTLYLKDGSKVAGKLVSINGKEYRIQSIEGVIFIFDSDLVEKVISSTDPGSTTNVKTRITRANLDTLSIEELNLYLYKAVKLRNAGRILTLGGLGLAGVCTIWAASGGVYIEEYKGAFVIISGMIGIVSAVVGAPIWASGSNRKAKAEITLQKLSIEPEDTMALGMKITFNF